MDEAQAQRRDLTLAGAALLVVAAIIGFGVWRQASAPAHRAPATPFQAYAPPPAPDYVQPGAWALIPATPAAWTTSDPPADVFFVHPTTFAGGQDWNGPIDDAAGRRALDEAVLPNQAGPFARVARLFAPRYRQASLYAQASTRADARTARAFAYGDIKRAFDLYLARYNQGRPIILAGVEQGGFLIARLARDELAANPTLKTRLAAVYLIDTAVPAADYGADAALPACTARAQARCAIGWISALPFGEGLAGLSAKGALAWTASDGLEPLGGGRLLCVNPLLGAAGHALAPAKMSQGASAASGGPVTAMPDLVSRDVSAQCVAGLLQVSAPRSAPPTGAGPWGYNLFFADIEADARARLAALSTQSGFQRVAPPITQSIDIPDVPVAGRGGH